MGSPATFIVSSDVPPQQSSKAPRRVEEILAGMLGAPVITGTEFQQTKTEAEHLLLMQPELASATRHTPSGARRIVCVRAEDSLAATKYLAPAKFHRPIEKLVLPTPLHHLFALERLRYRAEQLEMVPPGVDAEFFSPAAHERDPNLVVIPAFEGIDWNCVREAAVWRDARVQIVCSRECTRNVKAQQFPSFVMLREVDDAGRRDAFRDAGAVLILPREMESGVGASLLLEAMACAAPVVAARTWGLEHLMVPDVEGLFVRLGQAEGIRIAVRRLLSDTRLSGRLGSRARKKIETTLTIEHQAARLARICSNRAPAAEAEFYLVAAHCRTWGDDLP